MSREALNSLLHNPLLYIVAVLLVLLVVVVIWLLLRSRRGSGDGEETLRAELAEMERENQFTAAAEQMRYSRDMASAAAEAAHIFREYLGLPLLAVYAGRDGEERVANVLPKEARG